MRRRIWLLLGGFLLLHACGKSEKTATEAPKPTTASSVTPRATPFADVIASRGYRVVQTRRFPAQLAGRRGTIVVYQSGDGKSGGAIYSDRLAEGPDRVCWHWLFRDGAPDSMQAVEINNDGLWDVRVFMKGGKTRDFIQGDTFTLMGPERDALVALNGESSAPAELWRCFDGDTTTVWRSPARGAFIELPNPFGLSAGELAVRLGDKDRPDRIELVAGDAKQSLTLAATSQEQRFKLDAGITSAPAIRVQVEGSGESVAISELGIR